MEESTNDNYPSPIVQNKEALVQASVVLRIEDDQGTLEFPFNDF